MKTSMFRLSRTWAYWAGAVLLSGAAAQSVPSALQGTWRSDGYGWILHVSGNQITRYHTSSAGLISDTDSASELRAEFNTATTLDATTITAGNTTEGQAYRFTRLDAVPGGAIQPGNGNPVQTLDYALAYLSDHYGFSAERQLDWTTRFATARAAVSAGTSATALRNTLLQLIADTGDAHLRLLWEQRDQLASGPDFKSRTTVPLIESLHLGSGATRQARYDNWRTSRIIAHVNHLVELGGAGAAGGAVMWHRSGNTGYLFLADLIGFTPNDSAAADVAEINLILDLAFNALAGVDEMVVDLTLNGGGRDVVARTIAARFATKPTVIYTKQPTDGSAAAAQTFTLQPSSRPGFHGPVHLVTSDLTVSAAEVLTLAMRALPQVRHFGMPTHGSLSDMLIKPLPNGWALALSNERYTDAAGHTWEATGITPQTELPIFTSTTINQSHFERILSFAPQFIHPEPTPTPDPEPQPEPEPEPEPTPAPQPTPTLESHVDGLFNLSTRALVGTGNQTLISGLIIDGTGSRDLAITGRGPSLAAYGLTTAVADVRLRVYNAAAEEIVAVDSLADLSTTDRAQLTGYGILPSNEKETALILRDLPAGSYTIHLSAENAAPGVGILEVYDISPATNTGTALFNLSSRAVVGTGEAVTVTGFIITGEDEVGVLIRGQGPSLRQYGITDALANPCLSLIPMGSTDPIAQNFDYAELDPAMRAALEADGVGVADDTESALVLLLPPGAYTATLDAEADTAHGIGLIEFFRIED